jgi:uncharacterized protein YPO0396
MTVATSEVSGDAEVLGQGEQFRLVQLQAFNWGTFDGIVSANISESGYLFVGPSGSGKSTLLDAHTALLTPPKWVDFNVAAREAERSGKDRNVLSYMRGAWAEQTGEHGEQSTRYLRSGTTWSALSASYRNRFGRTVVLAQVLWVRGNASSPQEVKKLFLVFQREFDVRELSFFPESDFDVRRFKRDLPDAFVRSEFSGYQERFRSLLGIESELALRLLHKTQSAKNLGDLNAFLRDFMLDPPETFAASERLVNEFEELSAAHRAVVSAREQIEALTPARERCTELGQVKKELSLLAELQAGVDLYKQQQKQELLCARLAELVVFADGARAETSWRRERAEQELSSLNQLKARRDGLAADLASLQREVEREKGELPQREKRWGQAEAACRALGWTLPECAPDFVALVSKAKTRVEEDARLTRDLDLRREKLRDEERPKLVEFQEVRDEIAAMERQRSNIPAHMLALRARIVEGTGIAEENLPFVGELIEVKKEESAWRGAIERVLHGFALSLLVDDRHYHAVSAFVNDEHLGQRLVYYRVLPAQERVRSSGSHSMLRKLTLSRAPQASWLWHELAERFDYECVESLSAFRQSPRAVTQAGQMKQGHARHEKDDRFRIEDRRRWLLGFDNREKLSLYKDRAADLGCEIANLGSALSALDVERDRLRAEFRHSGALANLSWGEVDAESVRARIAGLEQQIATERAARPELSILEAQIKTQESAYRQADKAREEEELRARDLESQHKRHQRSLDELLAEVVQVPLTPTQEEGLARRFSDHRREVTLESLESITIDVVRALGEESKRLSLNAAQLENGIVAAFREFSRRWPAEGGGLDASLASAEDYLHKLVQLERDGLPRHEERFMELLHKQSDQNLTVLSTRLDLERTAIRERLELVNESLLSASFNPGTYLVIEPKDRAIEDVRKFKQDIREALSHAFEADRDVAERRFLVLKALVDRLKSQETADRNWRHTVLDVRQHVEFVAREFDQNNMEVEVYRSGAGKSGGQRQKLSAFCLAAALRYQLGGQDRALPSYATVVLDEAFDKADAEFTTMAMNIFKTFGFQMVVATPLKSVMTLEPFIGGASFVYIKDRKHSAMLPIEYDEEAKRLELPEQGTGG